MKLTKAWYKLIRTVNKNLPTILTALSVVGVGATSYLTAKAAPKAEKLVNAIDLDVPEKKEENKKLILDTAKLYLPPVIAGTLTVAAIITSNHISCKRLKSTMKSYCALRHNFNEYKLAALSGLGTDAYNKIQQKYSEKLIDKENVIFKNENEQIFFDEYSTRTFVSTLDDVIASQYALNRIFILRGYATLNDYYELLGLDKVDDGDILCWSLDAGVDYGYEWIDFCNQKHEDEDKCVWYSISMPFEPSLDEYFNYMNYGTSIVTDSEYGEVLDSQKIHGVK